MTDNRIQNTGVSSRGTEPWKRDNARYLTKLSIGELEQEIRCIEQWMYDARDNLIWFVPRTHDGSWDVWERQQHLSRLEEDLANRDRAFARLRRAKKVLYRKELQCEGSIGYFYKKYGF